MTRRFTLSVLGLISCVFFGCSKFSTPSKPLLFQNYRIYATRDQTSVEGTVFFRDKLHEAEETVAPQHVELNGQALSSANLPSYVAPTFNNLLKRESSELKVNAVDTNEYVDGYSLTTPSYSPDFRFVVISPAGDPRELNLSFEPVEPSAHETVILSRSRINEIPIVGKRDQRAMVGIVGDATSLFDEDQVKIDWENMKVLIPPDSIARLENGPRKMSIISGENSYLSELFTDENGVTMLVNYVSSFIFVYHTEFDVQIVD